MTASDWISVPARTVGSTAPPIVDEVLRSPGQPLDGATRAYMEPRFGHDFGSVRVHTDTRAAESVRVVDASAYTVGNHIAFGKGLFQPASDEGRQLVAHELAHTVQQRAYTPAQSPLRISQATELSERQAATAVLQTRDGCAHPADLLAPAPAHLARSDGKPKTYAATDDDLVHLQHTLTRILDTVDDDTRRNLVRNKTLVVGLVVDDDGSAHVVYTVNDDWTNPQLRKAADVAGATRWDATSRATGRSDFGAPNDAEQKMIEAADTNELRVMAMAVSRKVCADCDEAIVSYDKGRIRVVQVAIPATKPAVTSTRGKGAAGPEAQFGKKKATSVPVLQSGMKAPQKVPAEAPKTASKTSVPATTGGAKPKAASTKGKRAAGPKAQFGNKKVTPAPVLQGGMKAPQKVPVKAPKTAPKTSVPAPIGGTKSGGGGRTARVSSSRGGSGIGATVEAIFAVALDMAVQHYLQPDFDKKNEDYLQQRLQAQQNVIDKMIAEQYSVVQQLEQQNKPVFITITLHLEYQHGALTSLMDVKVRKIEVTSTKLEFVQDRRLVEGWFKEFMKAQLRTSESLVSFSLSYPDLQAVSVPAK